MSVVNHGIVSIEDGKKAETEYTPARKVRVELHFDVPEGQDADAAIAQVSALADAHVRRLLGQTANLTTSTADPSTTGSLGSTSTPVSVKLTRQAGPRSKPKPVEVVLPPETKADPAAVDASTVEDLPADDFGAPAPAAEVRPITDAELHSAAQKKNSDIKNPLAIRALVGSFRPAGSTVAFQLVEIPQDRRQEFLDKLAKLT